MGVNNSKIGQERFWEKWSESGAVGTLGSAVARQFDVISNQRVSRAYPWSPRMARVETVTGSEMNVLRKFIPEEAYEKPGEFYLVAGFKEGFYPSLRVVPLNGYDPNTVFG